MQKRKLLSDCEEKIMAVIWESDETLSFHSILERANQRFGEDWKQQTISTFLHKIVVKGYLRKYKDGRTFCYVPLVTQDEYLEEKLTNMSEKFKVSKEYLKKLLV